MVHQTASSLYHQTICSLLDPIATYSTYFFIACIMKIQPFQNPKMTSLQDLILKSTLHSMQSLPLDHLLFYGSLTRLVHLDLFSLACIINIRHISSRKMTLLGLEPQWYIRQSVYVVFTTRPFARCWNPIATYSLQFFPCIIKVQPFSKMTFVGPELERYITQHIVFTTRPLALCWQPTATIFLQLG